MAKLCVLKSKRGKSKNRFSFRFNAIVLGLAIALMLVEPVISLAVMDMAQAAEQSNAGQNSATSQGNSPQNDANQASAGNDAAPNNLTYPYNKTFVISAYYSPLQGQDKYVTGSYAGDIHLNGNGVHGADGSDVYAGMIAAPKVYPFNTKMKIPGIGVVAVHDRGGAIVVAGQKNQPYDRLDVWMGSGDAGLSRALNWGRRAVEVTVYGIDPNIKEEVYLEGYDRAEQYVQTKLENGKPELFSQDLSFGNSNAEVGLLQKSLKTLGYYNGDINNLVDSATQEALIKFQIDAGLVDGSYDFGAGYFGPQTRKALENALNLKQTRVKANLPQTALGKDDQGAEVKKLQTALKKLGYDVEVNGVYDSKTIDAIFKFQQDNQIISSSNDPAAGYFGPKTLAILADKIQTSTVDNAQSQTVVIDNLFNNDLKLGDNGDDVLTLQQELRKINLLGIEPNGNYGTVTEHAVFKFQQTQGLVADLNSTGAGIFGPITRARLNGIVGQRQQTERLIANKKPEDQNVAVGQKNQKLAKADAGSKVAMK